MESSINIFPIVAVVAVALVLGIAIIVMRARKR
jgi:hypothetical protein